MRKLPPQLKKLIQQAKTEAGFTNAEKIDLQDRILTRAREELKEQPSAVWLPWWLGSAKTGLQLVPVRVLAIAMVLFTAAGGVAVAAENALPGDMLYPVKVGINESVLETLAFGSESKARYESQRIDRRLDEVNRLMLDDRITDKGLTEIEVRLAEHSQRFGEQLEMLEQEGMFRTARAITLDFEARLKKRQAVLAETSAITPEKERLSLKLDEQLSELQARQDRLSQKLGQARAAAEGLKSEVERNLEQLAAILLETGTSTLVAMLSKSDPDVSILVEPSATSTATSTKDRGLAEATDQLQLPDLDLDPEVVSTTSDPVDDPQAAGSTGQAIDFSDLVLSLEEFWSSESELKKETKKILSQASSTLADGQRQGAAENYNQAVEKFSEAGEMVNTVREQLIQFELLANLLDRLEAAYPGRFESDLEIDSNDGDDRATSTTDKVLDPSGFDLEDNGRATGTATGSLDVKIEDTRD